MVGHNEYLKRATKDQETQQDRRIKWCKEKYPLHIYHRAAKITRDLRLIKAEVEIAQMQKAADISIVSFKRVLQEKKTKLFHNYFFTFDIQNLINYDFYRK